MESTDEQRALVGNEEIEPCLLQDEKVHLPAEYGEEVIHAVSKEAHSEEDVDHKADGLVVHQLAQVQEEVRALARDEEHHQAAIFLVLDRRPQAHGGGDVVDAVHDALVQEVVAHEELDRQVGNHVCAAQQHDTLGHAGVCSVLEGLMREVPRLAPVVPVGERRHRRCDEERHVRTCRVLLHQHNRCNQQGDGVDHQLHEVVLLECHCR
mmetsp:Transcript_9791/g.39748  ORF Transcript_9791/g.39748 Transcript_9791/m.39748 type:complete len:209 (+) Transcript_9791:129-755(+)